MYDVIYIDSDGGETALAQQMADRKDAAEVAKQAAAERGVGRMVLPGRPSCRTASASSPSRCLKQPERDNR